MGSDFGDAIITIATILLVTSFSLWQLSVSPLPVARMSADCSLFPLLKLKSRTSLLTEPGGSSLTRAPGGINGINIHEEKQIVAIRALERGN